MAIAVEIVTPEKLLLSQSVDMAVLPAAEGEMGVLVEHAPMIVTLRGGTVQLYQDNQVIEKLFVTGGFAEVTPTRVTVLADEAFAIPALSRAEGERRLAAAEADYAAADTTDVVALDAAMDAMQSARAMIETAVG